MVPAIDGVSFALGRGRTTALIGESGCGKSTLARTILHLYRPDAGSIRLRGEEVAQLGDGAFRSRRRHVQMVFQNPLTSFDPVHTIGSSIGEVMRLRVPAGDLKGQVGELLEEVGLSARFAALKPRNVSGGELQRAAIARALSAQPELVVMDEPTSALDMSIQGQVLQLLRELQQRHGTSYLIATHDLRSARLIADEVIVLYLGQIVEQGPAAEVLDARATRTRVGSCTPTTLRGVRRTATRPCASEAPSPIPSPATKVAGSSVAARSRSTAAAPHSRSSPSSPATSSAVGGRSPARSPKEKPQVLRIRYVNPTGSGELDPYFEEQLQGSAGDGVEISVAHLELGDRSSGPFLPRLPFYQGVLFETLYAAQEEGVDAAVIGCSGDPGLLEARRMLAIPVTAPLDAALHLASQLGQRVAILVADGFEAHVLYQDLARVYGLGHVISEILTVPMHYPAHRGRRACGDRAPPSRARRSALELAQVARTRGGHDLRRLHALDRRDAAPFREALGAPVIDPAHAAVLMAVAAARARAGAPAVAVR